MAQTAWRDMLPSSILSDQSRSDVLQQLTSVSSSGSGAPLAASGTSSDTSSLEGSFKDVNSQLSALATQITSLASAQQTQVSAMQDNTQALTQNTASKSSSGSSIGSTLGGIASSILGGGLGLSPIITGLMSLFGGGSSSETSTALVRYQLPAPIDYQAGITGSGQIAPIDYSQSGQPRAQTASSPQVTVQVNAMDSKSFLDHSDDIADAVRAAILSSHSLNDVISDL